MNNNVTITVNQTLLGFLKGSEVEVTIDSVKDLKLNNNEAVSVALEPGEHSIKMFFKYLGANCGFASAKFALGGNDVAVVEYNPPEILAMGGSISITTRKVEPPKPKVEEVKPETVKPATQKQTNVPAAKTSAPQGNTNKPQNRPVNVQKPASSGHAGNNTNTAQRQAVNTNNTNRPVQQPANTVKPRPVNNVQHTNTVNTNTVNTNNTNTGYTNYNTQNYSNNTYVKPVRNKFIAILLAVFLGGFGIHKFYTGKIVWGIIYLCLCWTGVPAYVALVEAIIYLFSSNQTFNDKFCS